MRATFVKHNFLIFQGYVKRQALYACRTCNTKTSQDAGICLACSYHCHENHDLIELYTKRNFRCDCGSSKMPGIKCNLDPFKSEDNVDNKYNQNFSGLYCTCHRPYPDPEDKTPDEMIQCIVCEDWYHTRHLGVAVPSAEDYSEMVCFGCVNKNDFLLNYAVYDVTKGDDEEKEIDVETPSKKLKTESNVSISQTVDGCVKPISSTAPKTTLFFSEGWREKLCKCTNCSKTYSDLKVEFLIDLEDRAQYYEEQGKFKANKTSQYENGLRALSSLGHVQQIDAITEYNKMTAKLKEYLQTFADNKKIVTEEDIKIFFNSMKENRPTSIPQPNFCR